MKILTLVSHCAGAIINYNKDVYYYSDIVSVA